MHTRWRGVAAIIVMFAAAVVCTGPARAQGLYDSYGGQSFYDSPVQSQEVFEGWWLGGTVGGATVSYDRAPATPGSVSADGLLGGIVGGYSWQHGPFVIGVEGDFLASDVGGSARINGGRNKVSPGFDTLADLRLRAGITALPNLLLFGTFGGAWANADLPINGPGGAFREATFFGWSAGAGAEYAFDQNWSARFDYQFTDFDAETIKYPGGTQTFDPDSNTYRGSLIYRF